MAKISTSTSGESEVEFGCACGRIASYKIDDNLRFPKTCENRHGLPLTEGPLGQVLREWLIKYGKKRQLLIYFPPEQGQ